LALVVQFYCDGLGYSVLARFEQHAGFDGVILGHPHAPYHLEFTVEHGIMAACAPSADHLLVFYLPHLSDYTAALDRMTALGCEAVLSHNPYWDQNGVTFEDADGYRVVLTQRTWIL
jgi:hypothetical protein